MTELVNNRIREAAASHDHVIWDWNGTLIDDLDIAIDAVNVLLGENGLPHVNRETYKEAFGFPIKNYYVRLGFDFEKTPFEKLSDRFIEEYNGKRATTARLFHGIDDILRELKKTKTQSLLSAAAQWHLEEMTVHFQIDEHFHHRFGIDNYHAAGKLERGHELIRVSGIAPEKTILIGDTDHDYEVAKNLGVSCLLIADGHQPYHKLRQHTENVVYGRR